MLVFSSEKMKKNNKTKRPRSNSNIGYYRSELNENPEAVVIYYILLAAIGAVSGVFAYYPHPGGQA